jgi:hypothetical protein
VRIRWHRAVDPRALCRIGVQQADRARSQRRQPDLQGAEQLLGHVVGHRLRGDRHANLPVAPREADLRQHQRRGGEARPCRDPAALGREGESAHRHEARARGTVGRV